MDSPRPSYDRKVLSPLTFFMEVIVNNDATIPNLGKTRHGSFYVGNLTFMAALSWSIFPLYIDELVSRINTMSLGMGFRDGSSGAKK